MTHAQDDSARSESQDDIPTVSDDPEVLESADQMAERAEDANQVESTLSDSLESASAESDEPESLRTDGLIVMTSSIGVVLCLIGYCLFRVFTLPPVEVETTPIAEES